MHYASSNVALQTFNKMMERQRTAFSQFVTQMIQPLLDKGKKYYDDFCLLTPWKYGIEVVYAYTKSEARSLLKRRVGKLPVGAGKNIIKVKR